MPIEDSLWPLIDQWIDLLWLPVALLAAHRGHRLLACGFVLCCVLTLRMQMELMRSIGHDYGFFNILPIDAQTRGLISYGLAIAFFLILARFSPGTTRMVFLAASLGVYMAAFTLSMLLMLI